MKALSEQLSDLSLRVKRRSHSADLFQHGYVASDVRRAAEDWVARYNVGPFFIVEGMQLTVDGPKGDSQEVSLDAALAQWGTIQIEFLQPLNGSSNIWRDALDSATRAGLRGAFHHVGIEVPNVTEALQQRENELLASGRLAGYDEPIFAYLQQPDGWILEYAVVIPPMRDLFAMVKQAAQTWDGSDPVRIVQQS